MSGKKTAGGNKPPIKSGHLFIGLAIALAIASAFLMQSLLSKKQENAHADAPVIETEKIVLAKTPISAGSVIARSNLYVVEWPKELYPKGRVYGKQDELIGRTARRDILPDEPIYAEKLAGATSVGGLPVMIPEGMRAVTIKVTDIKGVAGFIKPGDRVDVIAKVDVSKESQRVNLVSTLLQNVLVLAAEQQMVDERVQEAEIKTEDKEKKPDKKDKKAKLYKNITLAVWPDEAERLTLSEEMGELRLALRNEGDHSLVKLGATTDMALFGETVDSALGLANDKKEPQFKVELISGTEKTEVAF